MSESSLRVVAGLVASAVMLMAPGHAAAQTQTAPSPPPIASLVNAGDRVWVTASDGVIHKGVVFALAPGALEVLVAEQKKSIPFDRIRRIERQYRDCLRDGGTKGAASGLIAGFAIGLVGTLSACAKDTDVHDRCSFKGSLLFAGIFGGSGVGIGTAVGLVADAMHMSSRDVWRAGAPRPVSFGPIVAPGRAGVRVAFRW